MNLHYFAHAHMDSGKSAKYSCLALGILEGGGGGLLHQFFSRGVQHMMKKMDGNNIFFDHL